MTEPTELDLNDDFQPGDWEDRFEVSSSFVERTLERVVADRAEIAAEADRVEEIQLPREVLEALSVPEPSTDFVDRVASEVRNDREARWARVLETYAAPRPNEEFVERTLSALRIDRSGFRLVPDEQQQQQQPAPVVSIWRRTAVAAAAAVLVSLGAFAMLGSDPAEPPELSPALATQTYTPASWSTALSGVVNDIEDDMTFEPIAAFAMPIGGNR